MINNESINSTKIILPAIDREALAAEDAVTDKIKDMPWRFGVENEVNINPDTHGYWTVGEMKIFGELLLLGRMLLVCQFDFLNSI